ncbi:putative calcineurin-like phosphoesterase domain, ApaH type, metallo-dependent phosphatase [Helianthus annuus]|nr:putative calcineurin-like phosphoesterase domain, ApaH type, metallo-dependent phosphatase [Helianthus annuus]KAJ0644017.1 putative calcineurin-like phosphoesterase domain, ApaH type, metallo-dependent phosphatase [Helianthus annuus]KAJ0820239.1 putative calcineurin-like phosphoesterase domain, ApaH type, metallo-dependent phosphatase [Helianthus annuus]KAJ0834830.1 putative calcineurin-like phosphoesterase domain, ApaH type, metallo-dependent phosphatase [Helianthus annuus]
MGTDKQPVGILDTINMETVRTMLTHTYPYPHEHSRHAIIAVVVGCLFFISSDNMHTLIQKLDKNIKWWSIYAGLLGFFYFFSSPFVGKTIKPSYSNFSRWYIAWILVAALYHLPSFQSMGVDMRMNLSLFLTIFISSIFVLLVFHLVFLGLWYIGLVSRVAGRRPEILTVLQNCTVLSVACCVFYSHCGNHALNETPFGRKDSGLFSLWKKSEGGELLAKFLKMYEFKDEVCKSWFAPVGSARDYPLLSKWVIYGEFSCSGPCESSDEISPIYSLWATFIGLYIANYVVERSTGWALTHPLSVKETERLKNKQMKPNFLDMVPWYSGTSADLFKTVFDLLVSVTVFVGRFDMRMMQAAMSGGHEGAKQEDFLYEHFSEKDNFWFDFMADTGDGGNSSYSVAKLLAQPSLHVWNNDSLNKLPRGDLLLIGGDLAYPNPSAFTYEKRLFRPFEYALQPPPWYKEEHIAVNKPELPRGISELKLYDGPQCFIIPGNHDWFDGLQTFMRYICHKSWLGGWLMPQKKSYFALQLPKGWWVFGLDLALHSDIDSYQFKFFSELIQEKVKENDSVIVMTHEPSWLLDWYWDDVTGKNVTHLIRDYLKGRCKLRVAGDLHHYMRHSYVESDKPAIVQHLLVNGCGGAFLHPTHVFSNFNQAYGTSYETKAAYPSTQDSSRIALGNILKFRKKNWQFDFIGGFIYFILTFSLFPLCKLDHILQDDTFSGHIKSFFSTMWDSFTYMFGQSYVSSAGALLLLAAAISFVPSKVSKKKKVIIGAVHVSAHLASALVLILLMELGVETCIRHNLLATSGYHSLYEWYRSVESEHFPDPTGLRARIEKWTFGLYPACIKYLMSAFDVPEVMAVTRTNICKNGMVSLSRGTAIIYYASVFLYFWVFSTPVVSLVFGSYLYICINWLHLHFDEAFSSLRIANYKSFTRFHIMEDGNLEVFTLAVDKVPKKWKLDSDWDNELKQQHQLSQQRKYPSKWRADSSHQDPVNTVKVVDHFVIQTYKAESGVEDVSVSH